MAIVSMIADDLATGFGFSFDIVFCRYCLLGVL
jgi:hypothetical protein